MHRFFSLTSALIVCGLLASNAWAKDICVQDSIGSYWKFTGVKSLSQPDKVSSLNGVLLPINAPISGTAVRTSTGVHIGVFVYSMGPFGGYNLSVTFVTDTNFNGSGFADSDGDMDENFALLFTNVNCDTLPPF